MCGCIHKKRLIFIYEKASPELCFEVFFICPECCLESAMFSYTSLSYDQWQACVWRLEGFGIAAPQTKLEVWYFLSSVKGIQSVVREQSLSLSKVN